MRSRSSLFTPAITRYVCTQRELGLLGDRLTGVFASISNEITGPFLGNVDKVPFSRTRKGEETTTAVPTSLKFPFLQRQESQWAVLLWPAEKMCVCVCVCVCVRACVRVFVPASVCSQQFEKNDWTVTRRAVDVCLCDSKCFDEPRSLWIWTN